MGSDPGEGATDEEPEQVAFLSAYCMDLLEVTNDAYRACEVAGACAAHLGPYGPDGHPVGNVGWSQATAYCAWLGKRLPTEAEWEKAARGGCEIAAPESCGEEDERTYPWGDTAPTCLLANYDTCVGGTEPVGSHPDGRSPYGISDLAGNIWEFVSDFLGASYSSCGFPCVDPYGPATGSAHVIRGGQWSSDAAGLRVADRDGVAGDTSTRPDLGFRCASSL